MPARRGGVGRRLETDEALVGLERPLAEPVLLRLGRRCDDVGGTGLLVAAVLVMLLWGQDVSVSASVVSSLALEPS